MKKGKRVLKNNNLYISLGTIIFVIIVITFGAIIYRVIKNENKEQNEVKEITQQAQTENKIENTTKDTEKVSVEIGKTVEEQEKNIEETKQQETKQQEAKKEEKETSKDETNKNTVETKKEITFVKPTEGEIICEYAKDNLIYSETLKEWITHTAIDIKADKTSVVKSSADGIVKTIVNDPRYGLTVIIEHDDKYQTVYSNLLTAEFVIEGEEVVQGQTIGTVGNTASFESEIECHLHFEIIKDGEYVDPTIYLK